MSIRQATDARRFRSSATHFFSVWNLAILLVLLIVVFSILKGDTFLTAFTFQSMMNSRSINAMVALAVMIPLASNNFDLSVASILGISQVLANGLLTQQGLPWQLAAVLCILLGAFVGLVNGLLVTRAKINSFIATLGTGTLLLGLNQWYTGGMQVVGLLARRLRRAVRQDSYTGIPAAVVYVLIIGIVLWIVFDYLPLGRYLYVIGDSPRAAELTGISATTYVTLAFVASGTIAAFAGVMLQAQLQVGQSTVGQELMLPAFTGALLGATAIRPGRPNVWGTVLAVAVLAVAVAGLTQLGAPFFVENLFNGAMLILAVGLPVTPIAGASSATRQRPQARMTQRLRPCRPADSGHGRGAGIGAAHRGDLRLARRGDRPGRYRGLRSVAERSPDGGVAAPSPPMQLARGDRADRRRRGPVDALVLNAAVCPLGRGLAGAGLGRELRAGHGRQCARADPRGARLSAGHDRAPRTGASSWSARSPGAWAGSSPARTTWPRRAACTRW